MLIYLFDLKGVTIGIQLNKIQLFCESSGIEERDLKPILERSEEDGSYEQCFVRSHHKDVIVGDE